MDQKTKLIDCPVCNGTALVKVPYKLTREEVIVKCSICKNGKINEDEVDDIYTDTDGFKQLRKN
jgi:transcription elongation factor Elf1